MTNKEAIETIKANYPDERYTMLREALDMAMELLKAQEPMVLQIKEMAFLEIAVFIETNGVLEGKGTDLFLAIPYIYAVSQNMLDGYIAFVDGNTDVYDLQAIYYGKLWRCWSARSTEEDREKVKWYGE